MRRALAITGNSNPYASEIANNLKLLPKFDERDVDTFFSLFEHVANMREWPDSTRTLLQCVFTCRVQEAYRFTSFRISPGSVQTEI